MRGALCFVVLLCLAGPAWADVTPGPRPNPAEFRPHAAAAALRAAQGRWGEAAEEYRRALAMEPDFPALQADADALSAQGVKLQDQVFAAQQGHDGRGADAAQEAKADADRQFRRDQDFLALRSAFADAHANNGVALDRLGRAAEALAQFDAALKLAPALASRVRPLQAAAHLHLGESQAAQGLAGAAPEYREAVRLDPALAPAHRGLGVALLAQGQAEEAVGELREAARLAPADPGASLLLGTALVQTGQAEAARAQWQSLTRSGDPAVRASARRLLDQYPLALPAATASAAHGKPAEAPEVGEARERLRSSPRDPMAHNDLGLALHRAGRDAEALAELRAAVRLDPDSDLAHTNLGLVLGESGQTEAATREYREALKISPDDWAAHNNLGALLFGQGKQREAEAEFRAAVRSARNSPDTHLNLGSVLMASGRLAEAAQEFSRAVQLAPHLAAAHANLAAAHANLAAAHANLAAAHANLGFVWDRLGRPQDAAQEYRQAVALVPDRAQAFLDMARALHDLPNHIGAVASYRAVMRLFPDHAAAHAGLAELLLASGDAEGAGAEFQATVWRQPDFAPAYAGLGRVRLGQDRAGDAVRACRQALALGDADASTRNTLGLALYQSGDRAEARRQWQQVAAGADARAAHNAAGLLEEFPDK